MPSTARSRSVTLKDKRSSSFLLVNIRLLLLLRRFIGGGRRFLGTFRLCGDSFCIYDVDDVISNIARAINLGDSRFEEFGVTKHPRDSVRISSFSVDYGDGLVRTVLSQLPF